MGATYEELMRLKSEALAAQKKRVTYPTEPLTISTSRTLENNNYAAPSEWMILGARGKARNISELCARNRLRPHSVLEVGAGEGAILAQLEEMGFGGEFHALEVDPSGVEVITSLNLASLRKASCFDGYHIPYADGEFDLVILSHVLEHVEFERALLREIQRVSRYQIIEVPLDYNPQMDINWLYYTGYGHINVYTPELLRFLLRSELYQIMDDLPGVYSSEVMEYVHFENNNVPRTPEAVDQLRASHREWEIRYQSLPRDQQEKQASSYTVLTREITSSELSREVRGLAAILLKQGSTGPAEIVLGNLQKYSLE